ncbi:MAG: hypothetical protein RIR01_2253, partial [Bacteroidota bacterium]
MKQIKYFLTIVLMVLSTVGFAQVQ